MPKWPTDDARAQFLCSDLRDRAANELSFDSKVNFWLDYMGQFCREHSRLTFQLGDIEQNVLNNCPYRPTCLEAVIIQNNATLIKSKTDYETSLNWASWSMSVVTSPIRKVHSLMRHNASMKRIDFVHIESVDEIVNNARAKLEAKVAMDASWGVMSHAEVATITQLRPSDLTLFFKLTSIATDDEAKVAKIKGTLKPEDISMPNLRRVIGIVEQRIERTTEQIEKTLVIIKSKLRAKQDKQLIMRYLKEKKRLEQQHNDWLNKLHNLESIIDTYRTTQDNAQMVDVLQSANESLSKMTMTTTSEDVQELMDTIADAQADIGHVANVLANESTVGNDGVDETELEAELESLLVAEENEDISSMMSACTVSGKPPTPPPSDTTTTKRPITTTNCPCVKSQMWSTLVVGGVVTVYIAYRVFHRRPRNSTTQVPTFRYPMRRDENFVWMSEQASSKGVPRMFWSDGFFPFNFKRVLVLTDYDLIQEAFKHPHLNGRSSSKRDLMSFDVDHRKYNLDAQIAASGLRPHPGTNGGFISGECDRAHQILRKTWHKAVMRMVNRNELETMIGFTGEQIVANIKDEMVKHPDGINPRQILMNGALNVITSFVTGEQHVFGAPEQLKIFDMSTRFIAKLLNLIMLNAFDGMFPEFIAKRGIHKRLLRLIAPSLFVIHDIMYGEMWPFYLNKIAKHCAALDDENPRDYLDHLIVENRTSDDIGYVSIAQTVNMLYGAGGDTVAATLTWFTAYMARYQEIQQKVFDELQSSMDQHGSIDQTKCPYTQAVIEETFRIKPISESLFHLVEKDTLFNGVHLPAKTLIQANITSVHFNPEIFADPNTFNPSRFISPETGQFQRSEHVLPFTTGLRACPGRRIAMMELFNFASKMVYFFHITDSGATNDGLFPLEEHFTLLQPDNLQVKFNQR